MVYELISDWLEIEYRGDENFEMEYRDDDDNIKPGFTFNDKWYWLDRFIRVHNNPVCGINNAPDYIHGYDSLDYWNPLFIELADSGDAVRVYKYKEEENATY